MRGGTLFAIAWLLVLPVAASAAGQGVASPPGEAAAPGEKGALLATGALAPGFRLPGAAGEEFSYGGEGRRPPLLVAFFSVFCDPCRAVLSVVQKVREKYAEGGVEVACVSLDGQPLGRTVEGFAKQEGYTFRVLLDEAGENEGFRVADLYRVKRIPTLYLVDGEGRIAFGRAGRVREEELDKVLRAVLGK